MTFMAGRREKHRSGRAAGSGPDDPVPATAERLLSLDPVQERLLAMLRAAGDRPVPYRELETAGIEYPAAALYELEAAGIGVDRVHSGPERRLVGVRLDPAERIAAEAAQDEAPAAVPRRTLAWPRGPVDLPRPRLPEGAWSVARIRRPRAPPGVRAPAAAWALVGALGVRFPAGVAVMAIAGGGAGGNDRRATTAARSHATRLAARPRARHTARPPAQRRPAPPPRPRVPVSTADAARW